MSEDSEHISAILKRLGLRPAGQQPVWAGDQSEQALHSAKWTMRAEAIQEPADQEASIDDAQEQHPLARMAALQALGTVSDPLPVAPLLAALQDSEWSVRALAALLLRRAGTSVPLEPLLAALHDENEAVRAAVVRALGGLGSRVPLQTFEAVLSDASWMVREAVVLTLGEIGGKAALTMVRPALQDASAEVRDAAQVALQQAEGQNTSLAIPQPRVSLLKRRLSRRTMLIGLGAAALAGGGLTLSLVLSRQSANQPGAQATAQQGLPALALEGPGYSSVDALGNLYLMDATFQQTNSRILKLSPSGRVLEQWRHFPINSPPTAVAVDRQGNRYVSFQDAGSIYTFTPHGKAITHWPVVGQMPVGIAVDPEGHILVVVRGSNSIQKYAANGQRLAMWGTGGSAPGQFQRPTTIAVDAQGYLYIVDSGNYRIQKLSPNGQPVALWGTPGSAPGEFLNPGAIAIDAQQQVYVTDGETGLVQKFSADGQLLGAWGNADSGAVRFGIPRGVAADAQGNIYVSSADLSGDTFTNARITKVSPRGAVLAVWK